MIPDKRSHNDDPLTADNNYGTAGSETEEQNRKSRKIGDEPHADPHGVGANNENHASFGSSEIEYGTQETDLPGTSSEPKEQHLFTGRQVSHSENVGGTSEEDIQ